MTRVEAPTGHTAIAMDEAQVGGTANTGTAYTGESTRQKADRNPQQRTRPRPPACPSGDASARAQLGTESRPPAAAGQAGAVEGAREPSAAPMTDEAAAARPASNRAHGMKARSEQGRKRNNARNAARRKAREQGHTRAPGTDPPETEAPLNLRDRGTRPRRPKGGAGKKIKKSNALKYYFCFF